MGELSLGSFRLTGEAVSGADLLSQNKELRDRLAVFSSTINFLGAFLGEDFDLAHQYIEKAGDPGLWGNTNGLEVISLLHGNMEIRRARAGMVAKNLDETLEAIEEAKSHFNEATAISTQNGHGSYARAYLGLAGAESLVAIAEANIRGDASLIDTESIDRSLEYLTQAEKADYQPEAADITVKANYAKAQAALAYYAKTLQPAHLENAQKYYRLVIDEYESTENKRIAEFAALSYSGLARIAVQNEEEETAMQYFLSAQKISKNPVLKVQCLVNIGDVHFSRQEYKNALKYYQDAMARKADLEKAIQRERILEIEDRIKFIENIGDSL
jgi:tetratricopeptide (TPR) repeat protein